MSYNTIALIIFLGSSMGLGGIIFRKIPVLVTLSEKKEKNNSSGKILEGVSRFNPFQGFSSKLFLQKIIKKIRILSLKTDNKTLTWLQKLKDDAQVKKIREDEEYWDKVKNGTKK